MLPGEIQIAIANDPRLQSGYSNFLNWIGAGGKHGSLGGLTVNEAAVRSENMPWGENRWYDASGNEVSLYRPVRAGEVSPYGTGGGPSAPAYDPVASRNAFVPPEWREPFLSALANQPTYDVNFDPAKNGPAFVAK